MGSHQRHHHPHPDQTTDPGEPTPGRQTSQKPYSFRPFQDNNPAEAALAPGTSGDPRPTTHISLETEVPEVLFEGMRDFITTNPDWDQYSVITSALAGFLFQNGSDDRAVTQHYLDGLFPGP
jgi:hypothetical protein